MKKIFTLSAFLLITLCCFSQRIGKITLSSTGVLESFGIQTDDAIIYLSPEGSIMSYGVEYFSEKISNYSRLEPFQGRIDNFGDFDDASFRGKLKYLGKTPITYYASYDAGDLRGKVKSIGSLMIDYYRTYEDEAYKGKIKSIGTNAVSFFSSFDNELLRGKIKKAGFIDFNYYTSYDDKAYKGKIKNIGQVSFTYYSSFDQTYAGAMKTGSSFGVVNGVYFYVK